MAALWRKIRRLARREQLERELAEEVELHRELKQAEMQGQHATAQAAEEESRRAMGNMTLAREESRDAWSFPRLEYLLQDIRFALRVLRKNAGFSSIAVASLALGIAGNTAIFSIINALLIRPLPFREPGRLVRITSVYPKALFEYFAQRSRTMDIAFVGPAREENLTGEGPALRIAASETSANFFSVLGVAVEHGRAFENGEDRPGRDAVAILSAQLWRSKFGGDPDILGRTIALGGVNRRVIGIAPASFSLPSRKVQAWIPIRLDPRQPEEYWGGAFAPLIGRLRPGANMEQTRREIHVLAAGVWKLFPWPMPRHWNADSTVIALQTDLAGEARSKLFVLLGAVGTVLVIACANVASLLLARATTRRKEMAMRAALGAGSARILRQLLTESVVLAVVAGAIGMLLGAAAVSLFGSIVPADVPGMAEMGIDWRVTVFAAALSVATGLSFGIVPALSARKSDVVEALSNGSQRSATGGWIAARSWLIAGEIALTVVLAAGAGLLIRSLYDLTNANPGFNSQSILTVRVSPNASFCAQREACIAFYSRVVDELRGLAGVVDAAAANTVPLDGQLPAIPADVEDHPRTPDFPSPMLWMGAITPSYLRLMQIPVLAGRGFTAADGAKAPAVILISASTAKRFWPGMSPLGKHLKGSSEKGWRTVVGVVADVRQFSLGTGTPEGISGAIYMPYAQAAEGDGKIPAVMDLLVKTTANPKRTAAEMREIAVGANPDVPVGKVTALAEIAGNSISSFRSTVWIFLSFAGTALVLAVIGVYGLMSYSVAQRTYEISVRMAIGARTGSVIQMIMLAGLRIAALGIGIGIGVSLLVTRLLSGLLFGVRPTDPATLAGVAVLLFAISIAASSIPAWRAARIDPIRTLRAE